MSRLECFSSVPQAFFEACDEAPERVIFSQAQIDAAADSEIVRRDRAVQRAFEVAQRVRKLAQALHAMEVLRGDRVAIISGTRPEWLEADMAIQTIGAVSVAVYPSLPPDEVAYILFDSGSQIVLAENQEQVDKLLPLLSRDLSVPVTERGPAREARLFFKRIITFERTGAHYVLQYLGDLMSQDTTLSFNECDSIQRDDLASLVYTSGTTGHPKGVMQTHGNHLTNLRQAGEAGMYEEGKSAFLFLPLAHSFGRLIGYAGLTSGVELHFPAITSRGSSKIDLQSIQRDLRESQVQIVPIVPRVVEKMRDYLVKTSQSASISGVLVRLTLWAAAECYRFRRRRRRVGWDALIIYALTSLIRRRIRQSLFGPRFEYGVSGGARLTPALGEFFDSIGIEILDGYGLTEACVAITVNRRGKKKIGTVGQALSEDLKINIAPDGEILVRGPNIAAGYYQSPKATSEVFDREGWFHTGDLGVIDAEGFLTITGRKKEILVTAGGKKIAPEKIEERLCSSPLIAQAMVAGEGKPYCVALVTPNLKQIEQTAASEPGIPSKLLQPLLWPEVERINRSLASFETVKKICVLSEPFSTENGLLTPTLKLRRHEVLRRYEREIEELYREK